MYVHLVIMTKQPEMLMSHRRRLSAASVLRGSGGAARSSDERRAG